MNSPDSTSTTPQSYSLLTIRRQKLDTFYSVSFYPYSSPEDDPVFAVCGGLETIVYRFHPEKGAEVIQYFVDDSPTEVLCTSCWTKDLETGDPILCVGGNAGTIKVLNVREGKLIQTLIGHGDEVMDLEISPTDPNILASASADSSIRIWSLDPKHRQQPLACVLAGEGHRETVLTLAFHASGRYLLSGGMDHIVNLWTLPELPIESTGTDTPIQIIYPHFSSSIVHSNYIDCLAFHGDLILSKAAKEHKIILWQIQNFSSSAPPLPQSRAPTTHEWRETRSAYGGTYDRLLQFHAPDTEPFFLHFGLLSEPGRHPMLAVGGTTGRVCMWDLRRIENVSPTGSGDGIGEGSARPALSKTKKEDGINDPFAVIKPHLTQDIPKGKTVREVGFSKNGECMVAVGDFGMVALFQKQSPK
ncbi:WD40 repeat-like protein [Terfezia boudieri ATCC MYA-4762]|uniref:WD40 repeat-like protein n=1 Tax=Terfezia boudieri ATCC MYA-4762 TaxID=1051890 RepID=A0A3N4LJN4_9PEZI|nr:WD40 repeat-like protein [Terfezia boudieri ATCC MYA-4762]